MSRHLSDTPIIDAHLSSYFIRAPRRGEDHISQLWCDEGYWVVGSFSTHAEAIAAASLFADGLPEPGTGGNWFPRRSTMHSITAGCGR